MKVSVNLNPTFILYLCKIFDVLDHYTFTCVIYSYLVIHD
jgi:hypothetical protein